MPFVNFKKLTNFLGGP